MAPSLQAAAEEFSVSYIFFYNRVQILKSGSVETEKETLVIFPPRIRITSFELDEGADGPLSQCHSVVLLKRLEDVTVHSRPGYT